ncbi:MAG: acyl-CoA mutase large subunit family protein [Hyphomicrobiales bacterium]|nr:acyl-CoA mutase large subunit family protein [Hyphomicrobiales bacterium]
MTDQKPDRTDAAAKARWEQEFAAQVPGEDHRANRSGIPVKPLYTPEDWSAERYMDDLGYPGQAPTTRGIYASMHRGRTWTQRQLIGLATPEDYNRRMRGLVDAGVSALSLIPCNSVYRGLDIDQVDPLLLGTCGTTVNTVDDMAVCLDGVPIERMSAAMNDPLPFTLLAFMLGVARRRGIPFAAISGTSNQSDYISHYVANHMFYRVSLPGSRRILLDHIAYANRHLPRWNPVSIVGQHMQQAGATPAEAMGFTLSTGVQYAEDCMARCMDPDDFLPRFTFFFDISISFFEEVAKFRAGRRIWNRLTRERWGAKDPRSQRFKFHGQTSGVDLTRQQPLNNIARVTAQAIAGIFGGLQSMHTDAYDEVLSTPSEEAARIAVATQNVLREEAHLTDVIDPLGGSFYVEALTDAMEEKILAVMAEVEAAGGMYAAVESGLVQNRIGDSALAFQQRVESGAQTVVGVNAYTHDEPAPNPTLERPDPARMADQLARLKAFKEARDPAATAAALDRITRAAADPALNLFEAVVEAAFEGATNGEICTRMRDELGFGDPLVVA